MIREWIVAIVSLCVGLFFLASAFLYGFFNMTWWDNSCVGCTGREITVFLFHVAGMVVGFGLAGTILAAIGEEKIDQEQQLKHKV